MITPIRKNILVKPVAADTISTGGIFIPDTAQVDSDRVEVIAVGSQVKKVKPGQMVFRKHHLGTEIFDNDVKYLLLDEESILAISN